MEFNQEALATFNYYINERERIRQKKNAGEKKPWTEDPILQQYSFTNVLRKHDKTSKFFIETYYNENFYCTFEEAMFNAMVFRYFGSIAYAREVGWTSEDELSDTKSLAEKLLQAVEDVRAKGEKPFTAAYVVTNAGISAPKQEVVVHHFIIPFLKHFPTLRKIWEQELKPARWRPIAEYLIKNVAGMGDFVSKELTQDVTYTHILANYRDRDNWTPVGPGGIRGMNRVLGEPLKSSKGKNLEHMKNLRLILLENMEPHMKGISSEFDLHTTQLNCCEYDKYMRTLHQEGRPKRHYPGVK